MSRDDSTPEENEAAAPEGPGVRLRAAREEQNLQVETVAETLGLPRSVIAALEKDDYDSLGAPVYVRGYLRKYAHFLGLPEDELVTAYEHASRPHEPEIRSHLSPDVRPAKHGRWAASVLTLVAVAIIVVAAFWAWHYLRRGQETVQVPPSAAASAAPAFERSGFPALAPAGSRAQPAAVPAVQSQRTAAKATASAKSAASIGSAAVVPPALPGMGAMSTGNAASLSQGISSNQTAHGLLLRITDTSWIEVRAADHTRLYYDLAPSGATLSFDGKHGALTVSLGNASGVEVFVNGEPFSIPAVSRTGNTARFTVKLKKTSSKSNTP